MNSLVKELIKARKDLLTVINSIKSKKRECLVLGKWNLVNIISHLSGWALYQIDVLQKLKRGENVTKPDNIDQFNYNSVNSRINWTWVQIFEEFENVSDKLISEYKTLDKHLWNKNIYNRDNFTPKEFIKIEIKHYRQTHLLQIKELL
jgi:hypothetical protein